MICVICRNAQIVDQFAIIELRRDEFRLIIHGVPARACPICSESYVDEEIAARLFDIAIEKYGEGSLDTQAEFDFP